MSPIPASMTAARVHGPGGGPDQVVIERVETPRPGPGEVLVRVHAAAITRGELEWAADRLPAIPSYEFSGVVAAVAPDVHDLALGDLVYGLGAFDRNGAAAEYTVVSRTGLAPKPKSLSHIESATIPLSALAAWQGLFDHGALSEGERVLIHGAAGDVGSFAVQLARHRRAHVTGTTSTQHLESARLLGADHIIDHTSSRFEDAVDRIDLVLDTVGGDRLERSPAVLRPGGRLVTVATEPPSELAANPDISAVYFVVESNSSQLVQLARLADTNILRPTVGEVFPLERTRAAFERTLSTERHGKSVIRVAELTP